MNTPPTECGGSSLCGDPHQYGISNISNSMANIIHGDGNTNVGNVSHSYNNIINTVIPVDEEPLIRAWLSPLEPHRRHQYIRNRRLDGVGDWVLQRNEFESWCRSHDGPANPTLLCCGGQGVGKTYIR